ncbi:MAG: BPSS1780 family membrane protein [Burkholderiaceae bacterium]
MHKTSAANGWLWFKQGFSLFRQQPAELSTLFLSYLFLMLAVGFVPLLGQILPLLLVPVFSMAFMQACRQVEQGKRVFPNLLMTGFRSPAFKRLLVLGLLYLLAVLAAVSASTLIDGGAFLRIMTRPGGADPAALAATHWGRGMLTAALIYLPAGMCFWFAAPLVTWQGMGTGKAIFYSFFAVARAARAFIVYILAWIMVGVILPSFLSTIVALLFGSATVSLMVLLPLSLILTAILYCSFYPSYVTIFEYTDQSGAVRDVAVPSKPEDDGNGAI